MRPSRLIPIVLTLFALTACNKPEQSPLTTVSTVDLERYSGAWNELARYESDREAGCVGATAIYTLQEKGLNVKNSCYDGSGRLKAQVTGAMTAIEGSNNTKFKISFSWPFTGEYWILMLADDYRYSVVSDPDREHLWILSRYTVLSPTDRETIFSTLITLGFDPERLYWTGFKAMCNVESELKK